MKRFLTLFLLLSTIASVHLLAQQREITGKVTDAESGEPLIGVNVFVKGTTTGTTTGLDGTYKLTVPGDAQTLVFRYVGMKSQEISIGTSTAINVKMEKDVMELETAVVTAIGIKREKKALGYAVQEVGGDELEKSNSVGVLEALSGKSAGVQINSSSGAAGSSTRIVLRGQTSFNGNNEALIVVDGVRINNSENHTERSLGGVAVSNRALDIDPDNIESISVLKGAAAAALYGVEGARGVILITTKKGTATPGKVVNVTFSSDYTLSQISRTQGLQQKYAQGYGGEYAGPETGEPTSWGPAIDTLRYDGATNYKWDRNGRIVGQSDPTATSQPVNAYDHIGNVFQLGHRISNDLALSGGGDKGTYRFSVGHNKEWGVVPKNTFERTNVTLSTSGTLFEDKLSVNANMNYVKSGGNRIQQGSNTSGLMLGLLRTTPTFDNTNGFDDPADEPSSYQFPDGTQRNYRGGTGYDNPFWVINNSPFRDDVNRFYGNVQLSYPLHKWLTLSTNIGTDFYSDFRKQEFELRSNAFRGGRVIEEQINYRHTDVYFNVLGGDNLNEKITLDYNIGVNLYNESTKDVFVQGDGLNFTGFRELGNTQSKVATVTNLNERTAAVFASVEAGYNNFLYLTLTGRNDWVSTLIVPTKEFKAGDIAIFYPSASLSFIFTEVLENKVIPYGKIRVSYARVGGGAPDPYLTGTPYVVPNTPLTINSLEDGWTNGIYFPFGGVAGFTYNALQGSTDLVPSSTSDLEVGTDLRFLKNRLGLDASFYSRVSKDQIIPINIPPSSGFQRAVINSGELSTKGMEAIVSVTPVKKKDFNWEVGFNFSMWRTYVESLPEGVPNQYLDGFTGSGVYNIAPDSDGTKYEYGQILGGAFQHVNGVDANGNPAFDPDRPYNPAGALVIDDSGSPDPASSDYNPFYGYPLVDPTSRVIGNPNPDFLLGINSSLKWKNWGLDLLFDIKQGGEMWNGTKGALVFFGVEETTEDRDAIGPFDPDFGDYVHAYGNGEYSNGDHVFDGVKASNGTNNDIKVPLDQLWYLTNGGGFGSVAEHFIEDASFYRLRYVTLSYDLSDLVKKSGIEGLRIAFTGRNLLLFTPYSGIDPETSLVGSSSNGQGLDYFQLPGTRSYSLRLTLNL